MCYQRNNRSHNHCWVATQKEKRDYGNKGTYRCRERAGNGGSPRLFKPLFGHVQALLRQRANELGFVFGQVIDETVGLLWGQTPDLIAEGENFPGLGFVVLNSFLLARKLSLIDFPFTLSPSSSLSGSKQG